MTISDLHLHFHFPAASDDVLAAINQLKEIVKMSTEEVNAALDGAKASVDAMTVQLAAARDQFRKGIDEVILAIQEGSATPSSTIEKLTALKASTDALASNVAQVAGEAQELDDLHQDTPPVA